MHQLHFKVTHSCHSTTAVDGEYSPIHATRPRRYPWPSFLLRKAMVLFSSLLLPSRTLPNHPLCHGKKLIPSLLSDVTFDNVVENGNQCHVKESSLYFVLNEYCYSKCGGLEPDHGCDGTDHLPCLCESFSLS